MIKYELYDEYGKKVHEYTGTQENCASVILEHQNQFFRPIHYDIYSEPAVAKCVPVEVIHCRGLTDNASFSENRSQE
jgi:hypothetical protein